MNALPVRLSAILAGLPEGMLLASAADVAVSGIAIDSRRAKAGDLFVALRGRTVDAHAYVDEAVARGAVAVVGEVDLAGKSVPCARVRSTREALTWIAAAFHGWPGRRLVVIGVTGTDGKTTTANLIHQILTEAGIRAGLISTVNAVIGENQVDTGFHVTTPDAPDVQLYMRRMVEAQLTHAVLETTSHGWAQHRVDACEFDIGVVTNITHEHLDEHGSYESYRTSKGRLFRSLESSSPKPGLPRRLAVLNRDDDSFGYLESITHVDRASYGLSSQADLVATQIQPSSKGTTFAVSHQDFRVGIETSLPGRYNVSNILAAMAATVLGVGVAPEVAARGVAKTRAVPGRMERIDAGQDFTAIVDFAHTPNALRSALIAARELISPTVDGAHVIAVFGSAGLRDRAKRRMMAETAGELADMSILTAEDPRTESLVAILAEMAKGASARGGQEGRTYWRIPDRGTAIRFAVEQARPGDVVVVCGKGHEQSMCFGAIEYTWDDRVALRAALSEHLGVDGPTMPYLPTRDREEGQWLQIH